MDVFFSPPVRLQPYFGYRSRDRLVLGARALRSRTPAFEKRGRVRAMRTLLGQFASREEARVKVTLEIEAQMPDGASEQVVRTVTENSRTLKFDTHGFERD